MWGFKLETGAGLSGLMSWLANSPEALSDMASTYAAVDGSGTAQAELDAQP